MPEYHSVVLAIDDLCLDPLTHQELQNVYILILLFILSYSSVYFYKRNFRSWTIWLKDQDIE